MDVTEAIGAAGARRPRSGVRSNQLQDSPIRLKDGNLFLSEANVPDVAIAPGGTVNVDWAVANGAAGILPEDQDNCENDANFCIQEGDTVGYCYAIDVIPSWNEPLQTNDGGCISVSAVGATEQRPESWWQFTGPSTIDGDSQQESITFELIALGSGESGTFSADVLFETGGDVNPNPGEKEVDVDTSGDGGGGTNFGELETLLALTIIFALILQFGGN